MKKNILTLFLLVIFIFSAAGQRSENEIALREYFIDAEFFLAQEFYLDALNDYMQVYKRGYSENANINYRIGICYLNIPGQKDKAIDYLNVAKKSVSPGYRESSLNEKNAPIDVYLYLGNAYRINNELDKAIAAYRKYIELLPEDEANLHKYADQQIEACNIANEFMTSPVPVKFVNLGEKINSSNDDYKAVISGDGSTLVFMHRLPFYDAVYFSKKQDGEWSEPENITPQLLSDGDQFVTSLSWDGKLLLLTREDEFNSDILMSKYEDNRWTVATPLGSNINTKYWESHACLSKDGKTIYFASNRNKGVGEMDLYKSELLADGTFGPAENLKTLNTELNEDTPFLTQDGEKLFFSSQGFTSMGGYDIFVANREGDGWGLPVNLGYPVNTTDDDIFYYPLDNGKSALVSRIQEDGYGGTDVYEVEYEELPLALQEKEPGKVVAQADEEVVKTQPEEPMEVKTEEEPAKEMEEEAPAEPEKVTEEEQPVAEPEPLKTEEPVPEKTEVTTPQPKQIDLQPILFGFDKSSLTARGMEELDKVAKLLKADPELEVVLTGFTDPLGPESYNLTLSKKRAQTALNYLISKGVDAGRLTATGKGETNFIAVNTYPDGRDNPAGRKYNRRVEFEIRGTNPEKIIIHRIDPVPPELRAR